MFKNTKQKQKKTKICSMQNYISQIKGGLSGVRVTQSFIPGRYIHQPSCLWRSGCYTTTTELDFDALMMCLLRY